MNNVIQDRLWEMSLGKQIDRFSMQEVPIVEGVVKVADEALEVGDMVCKLRDDAKMWVNPAQEKWEWDTARGMAAVTRQVEVRGWGMASLSVWRAFDYPISRILGYDLHIFRKSET
ncbi:uncharacterized protein N7483_011638 [Penicillium malachiteum]|uniref:uncharacterized protein n=1 Tax=Penicillium malachiteum TaxID=1324776 RepID=UPI0025477C99|nr:uncharacterized protein N7483_011638 [Penicillium malachiteum]KAJ5714457.1 hypothetical protein N7483_011638 [Penicillium malachiteum]